MVRQAVAGHSRVERPRNEGGRVLLDAIDQSEPARNQDCHAHRCADHRDDQRPPARGRTSIVALTPHAHTV